MKKLFLRITLLICIILSALVVSACVDKGLLPDDYVEVENLRIETAEVYLSPNGDGSEYQLKVEILPKNADNQLLEYYIPSKYLEYVSVSQTGLIKAKAIPEVEGAEESVEGKVETPKIPLTVTSTTNKDATLTIMITIEEVEVTAINFDETSIELYYRGEGKQLIYSIEPEHAQDGRDIEFSSLNPEVATVSEDGFVSPQSAGNTHIIATGTTKAGKEITGNIAIKVKYGEPDYALVVNEISPKYNQIIGQQEEIEFNLSKQNPSSDPNVRIFWYVGEDRIEEKDGKVNYVHKPTSEIPVEYSIKVIVSDDFYGDFSYESEKIHIYNPFAGFEFDFENDNEESFENYMYGQDVTFHLNATTEGIDHFDWYLRREGQPESVGILVATTLAESPDLQVNMNLDGDYNLEAIAKNEQNEVQDGKGQEYSFNVNRYVEGDTIIVNPVVLGNGIPPESYIWYTNQTDEEGNIIDGTRERVGSTAYGETFYYKTNYATNIILEAQSVLNGVTATVDGEVFSCYSEMIRINPINMIDKTFANNIVNSEIDPDKDLSIRQGSSINGVVIDGVNEIGSFVPIVYWNAISNYKNYWVEITNDDGQVMLLNSTTDIEAFGDYYCKLPTDFVDFNSKFKIRIKQKGEEYTNYYCYGYEPTSSSNYVFYDSIDEERHTYYLSPINDITTNGYIRTVQEFGDVLDYIISYEPKNIDNKLVTTKENVSLVINNENRIYDREYSLKIYMDFIFDDVEEYYPFDQVVNLDKQYLDLYKAISGAQYAYCETTNFMVDMEYDINDGGYIISIYKDLNIIDCLNSDTEVEIDEITSENYSDNPYGKDYKNFAINSKEEKKVWTTDQMYIEAENGKQPKPQTDITNQILIAAKNVIREIIGKDMSDVEKVTAFYDWLILNTVYEEAPVNAETAYDYNVYHLEGVFIDHKAVCDGLSKAMSLLCWCEGIACYKISGYVNNNGHAWNRVLIGGKWYNVDITWGSCVENEYINHDYLLQSDEDFENSHSNAVIYGEYQESKYSIDYYKINSVNGENLYIESQEEIVDLLNSYGVFAGSKEIIVKISDEYLYESLENMIADINADENFNMEITNVKAINGKNVLVVMFQNK